MKLAVLYRAVMLLCITPSLGSDYFISNSGHDSNDGRSAAKPWQTLARLERQKLAPGDRVLFRRGDKWHETLRPHYSGDANRRITFGAYASGPRPILTGMDAIPRNGWRQEREHIYSSFARAIQLPSVRRAGKLLVRAPSLEPLTRDGDWWFDSKASIIYVCSSSGPPEGIVIQAREFNIDNNEQSYITYEDFDLQAATEGLRLYSSRTAVHGITLQRSKIQSEPTKESGSVSAGVYANVGAFGSFTEIVIRDNEIVPFPAGLRNWGVYFVGGVEDFAIDANRLGPAGEDAITVWHCRDGMIRGNVGGHNGENTIDVKDSQHVFVTRNQASDDTEYNIVIHSVEEKKNAPTSDVNVSGNRCFRGGLGGSLSAGIALLFVRSSRVVDNVVEDPTGEAILVRDATPESGNVISENLLIQRGSAASAVPVVLQQAPGTTVRNNRSEHLKDIKR
jgi:Periplasmic copper-binding protein (NosD)